MAVAQIGNGKPKYLVVEFDAFAATIRQRSTHPVAYFTNKKYANEMAKGMQTRYTFGKVISARQHGPAY